MVEQNGGTKWRKTVSKIKYFGKPYDEVQEARNQ